jgi:hypothetical protein
MQPAERTRIAATPFTEFQICGLHFATAPLLALMNTSFDSGVLFDMGQHSASIVVFLLWRRCPRRRHHPSARRRPGDPSEIQTPSLPPSSQAPAAAPDLVSYGCAFESLWRQPPTERDYLVGLGDAIGRTVVNPVNPRTPSL